MGSSIAKVPGAKSQDTEQMMPVPGRRCVLDDGATGFVGGLELTRLKSANAACRLAGMLTTDPRTSAAT